MISSLSRASTDLCSSWAAILWRAARQPSPSSRRIHCGKRGNSELVGWLVFEPLEASLKRPISSIIEVHTWISFEKILKLIIMTHHKDGIDSGDDIVEVEFCWSVFSRKVIRAVFPIIHEILIGIVFCAFESIFPVIPSAYYFPLNANFFKRNNLNLYEYGPNSTTFGFSPSLRTCSGLVQLKT